MTSVNICVPVLKRYDLLADMLHGLKAQPDIDWAGSTLQPEAAYVLNNGRDETAALQATESLPFQVYIWTPVIPMGVAESWNWFINNVPEERLITNDDVLFAPDSLQQIVDTPGDFVSPLLGQAYSCFLLRDSCVAKIGQFDEDISPGYAYFEDCDYSERMVEYGFRITHVENAGVVHLKSKTIEMNDSAEMQAHHRKFIIAQENFVRKWGKMPDGKVRQKRAFIQPVLE